MIFRIGGRRRRSEVCIKPCTVQGRSLSCRSNFLRKLSKPQEASSSLTFRIACALGSPSKNFLCSVRFIALCCRQFPLLSFFWRLVAGKIPVSRPRRSILAVCTETHPPAPHTILSHTGTETGLRGNPLLRSVSGSNAPIFTKVVCLSAFPNSRLAAKG